MHRTKILSAGAGAVFLLILLMGMSVYAETYRFNLNTTIQNNLESATLTAEDMNGRIVWTYNSPAYPVTELDNFRLITNEGYIYLVEAGTIKLFDFYTGKIKWINPDFMGSPTEDCYEFSSSGKLYIGGYYGPDLFVVDRDGKTIRRVDSLCPGSYWISDMWFYAGDDMRVYYESDSTLFTFNVLDYFGRMDGLD